jgi:hypothetical protein
MRMVEVFKDSPVNMLVKARLDTSGQGLEIYLKGNTEYLNRQITRRPGRWGITGRPRSVHTLRTLQSHKNRVSEALISMVSASLRLDNGPSGRLPLASLADGVCFNSVPASESFCTVQRRASPCTLHHV